MKRLDKRETITLAVVVTTEFLLLAAECWWILHENPAAGMSPPFYLSLVLKVAALLLLDQLAIGRVLSGKHQVLEEQNRRELKDFLLKQRTLRHDFNIHLMALSGMLETERYLEMENYLREMLQASREISQLMPLDDPAISAMLSSMVSMAKERDIQVECMIYYDLANICCDAYEINMILGNLIRNACEAVENLPAEARKVTVVTLQRRGRCILRVENSLEEGASQDERIFSSGYTSKAGHSGIGLAAVQKLVKGYGGTIFMEQDGNIFSMVVQLPLKT